MRPNILEKLSTEAGDWMTGSASFAESFFRAAAGRARSGRGGTGLSENSWMAGGGGRCGAPLAEDDETVRCFGDEDEVIVKEGLRPKEGLRSRFLWRTLCCLGLAPVSPPPLPPPRCSPELLGGRDLPGDFLCGDHDDEGSFLVLELGVLEFEPPPPPNRDEKKGAAVWVDGVCVPDRCMSLIIL